MIGRQMIREEPNSRFHGRDIFREIGRYPWKMRTCVKYAISMKFDVILSYLWRFSDVLATDVPSETSISSFWLARSDKFPLLSRLALRYLSVPTNSVDAERSVSQYTTVSAPQRQRMSMDNLANQVIVAKKLKTANAWEQVTDSMS